MHDLIYRLIPQKYFMYKYHNAHSITMTEYTERQKKSIRINTLTANHIEMPYTNKFLFEVILESTIKSAD